jgi:hypothetical protein
MHVGVFFHQLKLKSHHAMWLKTPKTTKTNVNYIWCKLCHGQSDLETDTFVDLTLETSRQNK